MTDSQTLKACTFIDKGGVGKSTTIAHLGVALSNAGYKTLLIDLAGKQSDLSKQFGLEAEIAEGDDWPNIATAFQPEWGTIAEKYRAQFDADVIEELIYSTDEGVDLIPAHPGLDSLNDELGKKYDDASMFTQLDGFLTEYIDPHYDAVLLDLPGKGDNIVYNGLFAARNVIVPVQAGGFESKQAEALSDEFDIVRERHGVDIRVRLLIPNMVKAGTKLTEKYVGDGDGEYARTFGDALAPASVPESQDIPNAQDRGMTIFELENPLQTAERAMRAYEDNADALVKRVRGVVA